MSRPRVLIADDHLLFAEGLRKLLEDDVEVVAIAGDGHALLDLTAGAHPDVVICDLAMPHLDGLEAIRRLLENAPESKVVVLSQYTDRAHVHGAFRAGARGYVVKSDAPGDVLQAIRQVFDGRFFASPAVTGYLVEAVGRSPPSAGSIPVEPALTSRETEIARLVAHGLSNQKIAESIVLSDHTVRSHLKRIFEKLEISNRIDLALYAVRMGIVDLEEMEKEKIRSSNSLNE